MEKRFLWAEAWSVAEQIVDFLLPFCDHITVAGSLRRRKPDVGDIEILYIPILADRNDDTDLFATFEANLVDARLLELEQAGIMERRKNTLGREMYGSKNKLMRHVASGIPVDLFAATRENWFNYLVCRTGPAELNTRIAKAAKRIGWKWHPYGSGFTALDSGQESRVMSEADVFNFVGISYLLPQDRSRLVEERT